MASLAQRNCREAAWRPISCVLVSQVWDFSLFLIWTRCYPGENCKHSHFLSHTHTNSGRAGQKFWIQNLDQDDLRLVVRLFYLLHADAYEWRSSLDLFWLSAIHLSKWSTHANHGHILWSSQDYRPFSEWSALLTQLLQESSLNVFLLEVLSDVASLWLIELPSESFVNKL